jgi:nucleoside-triphosphatase THEP1
MQLFSKVFREVIFEAVRDRHPLLGTIMAGRNPYADRIKACRNVELLHLTPDNRQEVLAILRERFV